jgi:acyl-CoA reductase-like NAD-dependent aldehyde dehydrogenase
VAAFERWRAVPAPRRGELVRLYGNELRRHREASMMLRLGFYGSRVFDTARLALLDNVPGLATMMRGSN